MVGCPSVCLSHLSTAAAVCGGFVGGQEISINSGGRPAATPPQHGAQQHGGQQQTRAVSRLQPP